MSEDHLLRTRRRHVRLVDSNSMSMNTEKTRQSRGRTVWLVVQVMLAGIIGAWLGVTAWDGVEGNLELVTVRASVRPAPSGETEVDLPPFGSLSARTHRGPLRLHLDVDRLHVESTIEWLKQRKTPEETSAHFEQEMHLVAVRLVKGALLAALIGAAVLSLLRRANWRYVLAGTASGVAAVALPLLLLVNTYDISAFSNAEYEGEISRAPYLLGAVQRGYAHAVDRIPTITSEMVELYRQIETTGPRSIIKEDADLRVLLVSDLHNNPLGLRFALDIAKSYDVSAVLVAGDVTDHGHPIEGELLAGWTRFKAPVVMVTGNHDSRSIARALSELEGVTVLDGGAVIEISGLRIMGYGDPAANRQGLGEVNPTSKDIQDLTRRMVRRLSGGHRPDILLVHNFRAAKGVAGHVPIVATGHSHLALVEERKGSVIVNAGTTGATGLRYFTSEDDPSYSAAVLHFSSNGAARPKLLTVDMIELQQPSGDFVISRKNVKMPEMPRAD